MAEEGINIGPPSMVWKAKCNDNVPTKKILTWQEIENEVEMNDVFVTQPSVPTEPRYLDYKSDEGFDLSNTDDSFSNYQNLSLTNRDDDFSSKLEDNTVYSNDSNYSSEMDLSYDSAAPEPQDLYKETLNGREDLIKPVSKIECFTENSLHSVEVTRRQIVPVRPHRRTKSCQEPVVPESGMIQALNQSLEETNTDALKLRDITRNARTFARPLVRGKAEEQYSDEDVECKTYKFISTDEPKIVRQENKEDLSTPEKTKTDFELLSDITAQTRKATRPKIKDLDFKPKSEIKRSKSVMQITSPTVPALSPTGDRSPMGRSYSSSSASPSDYYAFTYNQTDEDACFKCGKTVYQLDKVGPIRKALFHKQCFRCFKCGSALTVKNYCQNFNDKTDKKVYCRNHKPSEGRGSVSLEDKNISVILNHPKLDKFNNIIRGPEEERLKRNANYHGFRGAMTMPKLDVVCKQWQEVNKSFMDQLEDSSPRGRHDVLKLQPSEARSVWSRSAMGAASLDLPTHNPRRNIHHFYQSSSESTWNYM